MVESTPPQNTAEEQAKPQLQKQEPKTLHDMFNSIQQQHRQRFGTNNPEQHPQTSDAEKPKATTAGEDLDKIDTSTPAHLEESKDAVPKKKQTDQQQKEIADEIERIKETKDFQTKLDSIDSSMGVRPDNDTRVAVIGNVDSGKSTLVGVLTKSIADDGRGSARKQVFNFSHEQANGRTSSIGQEIMGFDQNNKQVQIERLQASKNASWAHIANKSDKLVTFLDLCGHEKYLKTTMFGLVGLMPDYAMIIVGANMGVSRMTREHLGISLALGVPIFFVVTKIDIAPKEVYDQTMETLMKIMKSPQVGKTPVRLGPSDDVTVLAKAMTAKKMCPIFSVSNVTGEGLSSLKEFLSLLPSRVNTSGQFGSPNDPVEFFIDGIYMVTGVGLVVAGTMLAGTVEKGQSLQLGPDKSGQFRPIQVRSIHHKRVDVEKAVAGQAVCFGIKSQDKKKEQLKRNHFRKGMILVDKESAPIPIFDFEAEVVILHHATTIRPNYQAVVHCGVIRQAAKVVDMDHDLLRTGDKGNIRFRYMYRPEYLKVGTTVLFREGRTKGLGVVSRVFPPKQMTKQLAGINN